MGKLLDWLRDLFKKKLACPFKDGYSFRTSAELVAHIKAVHAGDKIRRDISLV